MGIDAARQRIDHPMREKLQPKGRKSDCLRNEVRRTVPGILLWFASTQTRFGPMYALLLIYSLLYMPTMALTNALAFRQMKDPSQDFGGIRGLGTTRYGSAGNLATARSQAELPNTVL